MCLPSNGDGVLRVLFVLPPLFGLVLGETLVFLINGFVETYEISFVFKFLEIGLVGCWVRASPWGRLWFRGRFLFPSCF